MTQSGSVAREVQAWLDTIDASGPRTVLTVPAHTIVPSSRTDSAKRAAEFLSQLVERGRPVELRTGKVIGEGGMGLVREAEQVALGRTVAIKTLKPGRREPAAAGDLLREAWITGALEHPNVVPVHHLEIDDELLPLLILKRVDGVEWSALCHDAAAVQQRFGAADLLAWNLGILSQVLNAVRFAHARGVIHRDLKPSNVMIGNFGEVYLLDWGIAVSLRDDPSGRFPLASEATDLAGTPSYMAPEMLGHADGPRLSERTDVYLAGAVLFELIAGRPPHQGRNAIEIISSVITSKPTLPADAAGELAQICQRAMNPDPEARYASIEELQHALQGYLEHRGSSRLAAQAKARVEDLLVLATARPPQPELREEIYRQLAICRFAFHEALSVWRDNEDARRELTRATIAVAEYELACGDALPAVTLLSELDERPALLATAQAAAASQALRKEHLERIGRDADPTVHPKTLRIVVPLCCAFVIMPFIAWLQPALALRTHAETIGFAAAGSAVLLLISLAIRSSPTTAINRRVFAAGRVLFMSQTLLDIGVWQMGGTPSDSHVLNMFMWGTLSAMFAVATDRWLLITTVAYGAGFLLSARNPEHRMVIVSIANLVLTLNILWRWHPAAHMLARQERKR